MTIRWGVRIPEAQALVWPNERCIEVPLGYEVVAIHQPGWVLDAGCGVNRHMTLSGKANVIHFTQNLRSEKIDVGEGRRGYLGGDLRDLSLFADRGFDRTICLSTLEHIGFDNTTYGGAKELNPDSMFDALEQLCRVTDRTLLITVPFCEQLNACAQWRYISPDDLRLMGEIAESHGYATAVRYYGKNDSGHWYGGEPTPVAATLTDFPEKVNAFAAMRCVRE